MQQIVHAAQHTSTAFLGHTMKRRTTIAEIALRPRKAPYREFCGVSGLRGVSAFIETYAAWAGPHALLLAFVCHALAAQKVALAV